MHTLPRFSFLSLVIGTLTLIFLYWLGSVFVPIAVVEARYQTKLAMKNVFHTDSLRDLILPQFNWDIRGSTKNTENDLVIPAIFLDEPIIFNVDPNDSRAYTAALKVGIAQASSTAFPGQDGLGYYFAHSSYPAFVSQYNAVFYLLGKLKTGDPIYVWHEHERFNYKVSSKQITDPSDVSFLKKHYDGETIVLQTCWPPGTTAQRLLVFAERTQ